MYKRLFFDDYQIGDEFKTDNFEVTSEEIESFAKLTFDINPLHLDELYAKERGYNGIIAHGLLCVSLCSGLAYKSGLFDKTVIGLISQSIKYKKPVYTGEKLQFSLKVIGKRDISGSRGGLVMFETKLVDKNDNVLIMGEWNLLIAKKNI